MENKINIAEILKDCPKGMKLYSPLLGKVTFEELTPACSFPIKVIYNQESCYAFSKTGLYYPREGAECLLFTSSEMRDWKRFFKRGDIVIKDGSDMAAVFDGWANDAYTEFNTTVNLYRNNNTGEEEVCKTLLFRKATPLERNQFIGIVERILKGKYNPETLQVKPIKPEVPFNLKPFDKILVRDDLNQKWTINMFSHYDPEEDDYHYVCVSSQYRYCLPYNEQTAYLVGTKEFYNP